MADTNKRDYLYYNAPTVTDPVINEALHSEKEELDVHSAAISTALQHGVINLKVDTGNIAKAKAQAYIEKELGLTDEFSDTIKITQPTKDYYDSPNSGYERYDGLITTRNGRTFKVTADSYNIVATEVSTNNSALTNVETTYRQTDERHSIVFFNTNTNIDNKSEQQSKVKKKTTTAKAEQRYSVNTKDTGIDKGVQNYTLQIESGNALDDKSAAAVYAYNLKKGELNHIFHNDFYHEDPIPAWSFSVDFIPCTSNPQFDKIVTMKKSMTLTKAVQKITAMDKTVNVQNINYLGMQHPFFTKMQATHGDLRITFAEDEYFTITSILTDILKYASFLPSFVTNQVYVKKQGDWTDKYIAYAASDTIAPKYRQNATNMQVDDPNIAKLVHQNKFVFDIVLKLYRAEYVHMFADDTMSPGFVYHYHDCWLKSMDSISLNYDNDSMIDRTATFSYQYMTTEPYSTYLSRHRTVAAENTNSVNTTASKNAAEQLMEYTSNEVNTAGNKAPANMSSEAAKQFEKRINDETKTNGMTNQQAQAAQIAGEMHKYRR